MTRGPGGWDRVPGVWSGRFSPYMEGVERGVEAEEEWVEEVGVPVRESASCWE